MSKKLSPDAIKFLIENNLLDEAQEICQRNDIDTTGLKPKPVDPKNPEGSVRTESYLNKFITQDSRMIEIKRRVRILANIDDPVLITGPSGTGKELIAQALHGNRKGEFIAINCAGMPKELIESELFGYTKGAFTGANTQQEGLIRAAKGGTLFLDEIGDLPLALQAKLLRVIQEHKVRSVGGYREEVIDCRFVAATHWNLRDRIPEEFRLDLYARISTFELKILALRERTRDIELIVKSLDPENKFPRNIDLTTQELPYNVRSLQQIVKRFLILGEVPGRRDLI